MRTLLVALALAAAPASAQRAEPDSASDADRFSLGTHAGLFASDGGVRAGYVGVTGAYRVAPKTAVTFTATGGDLGPGRDVFLSLGPGVVYTDALDERSTWTAQADVRVTGSQSLVTGRLPYRGTSAFGAASADRAFKVVGSVEVVPTVGAYAAVGRWMEATGALGDTLGGPFASAGLLGGASVRFSAFGRTWSIPLVVPVEVFGRGDIGLPAYAGRARPTLDADSFFRRTLGQAPGPCGAGCGASAGGRTPAGAGSLASETLPLPDVPGGRQIKLDPGDLGPGQVFRDLRAAGER